jgi:hypothetical protein
MRKRYIQVEDELLAEFASDLSVHLGCNKLEAIGHTNLLISWLLNRCPKDRPPSASAVHEGPLIEKLIARACEYTGDPATFVDAYVQVRPQVLERLPSGGVRGKGLDRYDGLWAKNYPAAAKAWKAAHPGWRPKAKDDEDEEPGGNRSETVRIPNGNRGDSPPLDPDPDPDREKDSPPPPRPVPKLVVVGKKTRKLTVADLTPAEREKWERIQLGRTHNGLLRETDPPAAFPDWCAEVDLRCADGEPQWVHAMALYLRDEHFADRKWPTAVFITPGVWLQRLPQPPEEVML